MFRVLLYDQWKVTRLPLAMFCVSGFGLPILSIQHASGGPYLGAGTNLLLADQAMWGTVYPLLAAGVGLLLGVTAWSRDHRTDHVYALSLPVPRWQYALLKFSAGSFLMIPVILTLGGGATAAAVLATVPEGLSAYPVALTIRYALASTLAFSIFFAISAATQRTAGVVLGSLAVLVGGAVFVQAIGFQQFGLDAILGLVGLSGNPLDAFGGRWMLIDV